MTRRICARTILVLLLAMTPVAPGYAVGEPPVPNWANKDVLFELVSVLPTLAGDMPLYLVEPKTFAFVPVEPNEMAIGYLTVRSEISFP